MKGLSIAILLLVGSRSFGGDAVLLANGSKIEGRIVKAVPAYVEIQKPSGVTMTMDVFELDISVKTGLPERISGIYKTAEQLKGTLRGTTQFMEQHLVAVSNAFQKSEAIGNKLMQVMDERAQEAKERANAARKGIRYQISSVDMKIVDDMDDMVNMAWMVTIRNFTDEVIRGDLDLVFKDKDGFKLDSSTAYRIAIPPGGTVSVSEKELMTKEKYRAITQTSGTISE